MAKKGKTERAAVPNPKSPTEARARRVRPPPEKYDPDNTSHWSITKTLAWIIRRDLDAVRSQCDSYREKCADWRYVPDATARAKVAGVAMMNISTGKIAPFDPDLQKKLQKKLPKKLRKDFQKGSWHLCSWKPSGWNTLPASEHIRPQVAIDELWQAAGIIAATTSGSAPTSGRIMSGYPTSRTGSCAKSAASVARISGRTFRRVAWAPASCG
jgi:hypothetical protein